MIGRDRLLGNQHGDAGPVRFVILSGDVEDVGPDDGGDVAENLGEPFGVVGFVDIRQITFLLRGGRGVANIVNIEAQGFGQVVEPLQPQSGHGPRSHGVTLPTVETAKPAGSRAGASSGKRASITAKR